MSFTDVSLGLEQSLPQRKCVIIITAESPVLLKRTTEKWSNVSILPLRAEPWPVEWPDGGTAQVCRCPITLQVKTPPL